MTDVRQTKRQGSRGTDPRPESSPSVRSSFRSELVALLPHLRAVARALTGHRYRADDLVNDTVLKALSAEAQFQPGTHLRAWLMTILRNHYINGLRRNRIEVSTVAEIPEGALPSAPNQDNVVEVAEIAAALQLMSVEHREILVLVSAAGLSYEEAAGVCGCAVGTIKSRLNRARAELKRVLGHAQSLRQRAHAAESARAREAGAEPAADAGLAGKRPGSEAR